MIPNKRCVWSRWLCLLVTIPFARSAQSTLRVAACSSGEIPYVTVSADGTAVGFDIDLWQKTYTYMQARIETLKASGSDPAIVEQLSSLIGSSPPDILLLSSESIQKGLADKTIDIGMCGYPVTQYGNLSRLQNFDFSTTYLSTGLQAAVQTDTQKPSFVDVLVAIFGTIDSKAQLVFVILLLFLFIFGHLIAAAENFSRPSDDEDGQIRNTYYGGTQDGMWYSAIIMSTVGLGDILPKTSQGKLLTLGWMIISIAMISMLYAVVTSNFGNLTLVTSTMLKINGPSDLSMYTVGISDPFAEAALRAFIPDPTFRIRTFPPPNGQIALFQSVLNGSIDVAVERPEIIDYYASSVPAFQNRLQSSGPVFLTDSVAFAVRRIDAVTPHPLLGLVNYAVAQATVGNWQWTQQTATTWFGSVPGAAPPSCGDPTTDLEQATISDIKYQALATLLALLLMWALISFVTTLRTFPESQALNDTCEVIRWILDIPEQGQRTGPSNQKSLARIKSEVEVGLAYLLTNPSSNLHPSNPNSPGGAAVTEAIVALAGSPALVPIPGAAGKNTQTLKQWRRNGPPGAAAAAAEAAERGKGGAGTLGGSSGKAERLGLRLNVDVFVNCVACKLAEAMPGRGWWRRHLQLDYGRDGAAFVRDLFYKSYHRVENLIDEWVPPSPGMVISVDNAADVIVDILMHESAPLLQGGALKHPHMDPQRAAMERGFDQVLLHQESFTSDLRHIYTCPMERGFDQVFRQLRSLHQRVDSASYATQGIDRRIATMDLHPQV